MLLYDEIDKVTRDYAWAKERWQTVEAETLEARADFYLLRDKVRTLEARAHAAWVAMDDREAELRALKATQVEHVI